MTAWGSLATCPMAEAADAQSLLAEACDRFGTDHLALEVTGTWMVACPEGSIQRTGSIVVDITRGNE